MLSQYHITLSSTRQVLPLLDKGLSQATLSEHQIFTIYTSTLEIVVAKASVYCRNTISSLQQRDESVQVILPGKTFFNNIKCKQVPSGKRNAGPY